MRPDETYLIDIVRAAETIQSFRAMTSREHFQTDVLLQSGVLHQLMVIGEATKKLSMDFRNQHPAIAWKLIAGMRDRITHAYFEIDLEEVWNTIDRDIPDLIEKLSLILPKSPSSSQ